MEPALPKVKAVVFDVDGTLLNTKEFIFQAFEHTLTFFDEQLPSREVVGELVGYSLNTCYANLAPHLDIEQVRSVHRSFQDTHLHLIQPYDGLVMMLEDLKLAGIKLGVYSSRYGNLVESLKLFDTQRYFDVIIKGDEVKNAKPHPEGVQKAAAQLDVPLKQAVMVGDSWVDIAAGKAANIGMTIGVTHGFCSRERLIKAAPDYVLDSLGDVVPLLLSASARTADFS